MFFHAKTRTSRGVAIGHQSWCETCQRIQVRIRKGIKERGVPFGPRQPAMSEEERRARKRESYRKYMSDPANRKKRREQQREYQREWQAQKRRQEGVPVRGRKYNKTEKYEIVDAAPFLEWLTQYNYERLSPSGSRRVREARKTGRVEIGAVDRILIELEETHVLQLLYPVDEE